MVTQDLFLANCAEEHGMDKLKTRKDSQHANTSEPGGGVERCCGMEKIVHTSKEPPGTDHAVDIVPVCLTGEEVQHRVGVGGVEGSWGNNVETKLNDNHSQV